MIIDSVQYGHDWNKQGVRIVFDWNEAWGEMPDVTEIMSSWVSTTEAASEMDVTDAHVRRMCIDRAIPSVKLGNRWYVDPEAAGRHKKGKWRY